MDFTAIAGPASPYKNRCVVRLKTTCWMDSKGIHEKRSLIFLRRKCVGYNIVQEDASSVGAEEVFTRIVNLDSSKDGVYEVFTHNHYRDWETGVVEDYGYKLVEFQE